MVLEEVANYLVRRKGQSKCAGREAALRHADADASAWGYKARSRFLKGSLFVFNIRFDDGKRNTTAACSKIRWTPEHVVPAIQRAISALEEASRKTSGKTRRFPVNASLATLYARLRKIHGQIARQRQDFYHMLTTALVQRFGLIAIEKMSLKNMIRAPKPKQDDDGTYLPNGVAAKAALNRSLSDGAPAAMMRQCRYKAGQVGSILLELPTKTLKPTQRCCRCDDTQAMQLSERTYECPCGNITDRDENAARTMLRFAFEGARWVKGKQPGTVRAAVELSSA